MDRRLLSEVLKVRISPEELREIDRLVATEPEYQGRAKVVRRLIRQGLAVEQRQDAAA